MISGWLHGAIFTEKYAAKVEEYVRSNGAWPWGDAVVPRDISSMPPMSHERLERLSKRLTYIAEVVGDAAITADERSEEFVAFFQECERAIRAHFAGGKNINKVSKK